MASPVSVIGRKNLAARGWRAPAYHLPLLAKVAGGAAMFGGADYMAQCVQRTQERTPFRIRSLAMYARRWKWVPREDWDMQRAQRMALFGAAYVPFINGLQAFSTSFVFCYRGVSGLLHRMITSEVRVAGARALAAAR